jgi:hypothetical protein
MKKLLILITLLTGLSTMAQATSPVKEAKVKDYFSKAYPLIELAMVCDFDDRFESLEKVIDTGYKLYGAQDSMDRQLVDMFWSGAEMEFAFGNDSLKKEINFIKNNPKAPDSVMLCQYAKQEIKF